MPKFIDHEERKIHIAEATWKVIREEGIEKATVRKIADAAGLSTGSLRHYFSSQSELLAFSMELVSERVRTRAESNSYTGTPFETVMEALCELIPIDSEKRLEMEVWLAFSSKMLIDEKLKALGEEVYEEMRGGMSNVLRLLDSLGLLHENADLEMEASRLHALVDGMAMHHLMHPDSFSKEKVIEVLEHHLKSICT
ncbi:TetR family transcriptional regulator [Halobacillus litoralis]|uniref:TetR/AcrR family transcriptional regulator n=1 Tax=Halobacillus litoralis TaxID=45668 RepID=UPI001CD1D645|nr:TetR/AcrR family transcriptional regulator [Halobacillus litoralis]MCA0972185.1 TetR family transcriptional regulator [Halobacillus litoralis]